MFQTGHVIEIVTKLFLVVQNATGKPPEVNITTEWVTSDGLSQCVVQMFCRFEANFGSQTVTFTFKCMGLPEVQPGQIRVLRKANKMEVHVWHFAKHILETSIMITAIRVIHCTIVLTMISGNMLSSFWILFWTAVSYEQEKLPCNNYFRKTKPLSGGNFISRQEFYRNLFFCLSRNDVTTAVFFLPGFVIDLRIFAYVIQKCIWIKKFVDLDRFNHLFTM